MLAPSRSGSKCASKEPFGEVWMQPALLRAGVVQNVHLALLRASVVQNVFEGTLAEAWMSLAHKPGQ